MSATTDIEKDKPNLWRLTDADKWSVTKGLLLALPVGLLSGPIGLIRGYNSGRGPDLTLSELFGVSDAVLAAVFVTATLFAAWGMLGLSRGWLARLDEAERHIEMLAITETFMVVMMAVGVIWGFGQWIPGAQGAIADWWAAMLSGVYLVYYFTARARIRARMSA